MRTILRGLTALLGVIVIAGCGSRGSLPGAFGAGARAKSASGDLLYVADLNRRAVFVYTYPAGQLTGTLAGVVQPHGECTDAAGDVFVTDGTGQNILEYAHGGTTPIATLADPNMFPESCAVDPTTGNLAVVHSPVSTGPATVGIYVHASGSPQALPKSPVFDAYYLAYDSVGNIWLDGMNRARKWFRFAEFLTAQGQWQKITFDHFVALPGGVQWVGKELVVGDQLNLQGPSAIDEFSMTGTTGKLIRSTPLQNSCNVLGFVVAGKTLVAGNTCKKAVLYFNFPKGGMSTKAIKHKLSEPLGVVISH